MSEPVVVVAMGASTPIGRDAWSSAAAVRAGITGFGQHPYMIDEAGEPMRVARAEWLDIDLGGVERFEALLVPAVEQVLEPLAAQSTASRLRVAVAIALPSPRPGLPSSVDVQLRSRIIGRFGGYFGSNAVFSAGHAAGLIALDAAFQRFNQGALDACVVAGVDSYMEPETLEWLESCDQLHGAGPLNNAWGFIPGEAAGALLLMRASVAQQRGLASYSVVLGAGTGYEPNRIKTESVCIGAGLTEAFRRALSALPPSETVSDVYCDMNGEPYRADEYGFTCLRTKESFVSPSDFIAPADCWGDVAAAGGALHVILATIAGVKRYSRGKLAYVWSSAEGGERAGVLLATKAAQ